MSEELIKKAEEAKFSGGMTMNEELFQKVKEARTVEELLALAKENSIELTEEQAKAFIARVYPASGELADDELDAVAGGYTIVLFRTCPTPGCGCSSAVLETSTGLIKCPQCRTYWDTVTGEIGKY